jgi:predicted enzyme related to lactoylglutathione lyase
MPEVTSHAPGSFCWIELNTSDPAAAKKFYSGLFGWEAEDMPAGPDMVYTMLKIRGLEVGAMCGLQPEQKAHGVPPHWMSYVAVESADDAAKKAASLGGSLLADAFDVMDVGRMAIIQDPLGATFCVWQAKAHIGAKLVGDVGAFGWDELWTTDRKKAAEFYTGLFGWQTKGGELSMAAQADSHSVGDAGVYVEISNAGQPIGGMMEITPDMGPVPPNWLPYLMVEDCNAIANKAAASGGKLFVPPTDIPNVGRFSVIADPQGAMFAIIKLTGPHA